MAKKPGSIKYFFHTAPHSWAVRPQFRHTEVYAKILNEELDKAMEVFNNPIKTWHKNFSQ